MKQKIFNLTVLIFCTLVGVLSCNKSDDSFDPREQFVTLDKPVAQLEIGEGLTLSALFGEGVTPSRTYEWSVDNGDVVQIGESSASSLSLVALQGGVAIVKYGSTDGQIYATSRVVVRGDEEEQIGLIDAPVFIAFGADNQFEGWNVFVGGNNHMAGTTLPDLVDQDGQSSGVSMTITERFNGRNAVGVSQTNTPFNMPEGISRFSYFGNSGAPWSGLEIKQSTLVLLGLDPDKEHDFCFFGSRASVSNNRETDYIVKGAEEKTARLNTSSNASEIACVQGIKPESNGVITIVVTAGPNNNDTNGFYYLNAMRITLSE